LNKYSLAVAENWEKMPKKYVFVNEKKLIEKARKVALQDFPLPQWKDNYIFPINNKNFVSHIFWHNVINFCYGHPWAEKEDGSIVKFEARDVSRKWHSGAYAMGACWYRYFGENEILAEDVLRVFGSLSQTKKFFKGRHHLPLVGERRILLTESAFVLNSYFRGNPRNILEEGNYRAFGNSDKKGIVNLLVDNFRLTFGSDKNEIWTENAIFVFHFYKRAQLFVLEYNSRAVASGGQLKPIEDIEEVGPIADYQLPKSYAGERIFSYANSLNEDIKSKEPLESGSKAEVEIRAATVWAQLKELEIINNIRESKKLPLLHIGHIDNRRWNIGRKAVGNHHICLTTAY